jgi:hypothetical protein
MTGRTTGAGTGDGRTATWIEVISTTVLALAAIATTWSGYQASRWHDEVVIAIACAVLLGTVAWMAAVPVSVSI